MVLICFSMFEDVKIDTKISESQDNAAKLVTWCQRSQREQVKGKQKGAQNETLGYTPNHEFCTGDEKRTADVDRDNSALEVRGKLVQRRTTDANLTFRMFIVNSTECCTEIHKAKTAPRPESVVIKMTLE